MSTFSNTVLVNYFGNVNYFMITDLLICVFNVVDWPFKLAVVVPLALSLASCNVRRCVENAKIRLWSRGEARPARPLNFLPDVRSFCMIWPFRPSFPRSV